MEYLMEIILIFFISADLHQSCTGCGRIIKYQERVGYIESPNFRAVYGKAANCSWQFQNITMGYALILIFRDMRMYYHDVNGDKQCGDSYRLVINGERVDCMLDMAAFRDAKSYHFYSNPSCTTCDFCNVTTNIESTSIGVEYFADGSKPINAEPEEMLGFRISYFYEKCQTATTPQSTEITATSTTTTIIPTTTPVATRTTARPRSKRTTATSLSDLYQSSMGCGGIIKYEDYDGSIHSPNFGVEFGKVANCSWQFDSINSGYALQLKLTAMKMYYYDVNGDKQCGDSYRLAINGEQVDCMLDISGGGRSAAKYYLFYSNPSCANMYCSFYCGNKIKIDSPSIKVKYIADGSKPINKRPDEMWGFKIQYNYVECPPDTKTVETSSRVTSASPTSVQKATSANPTSETTMTTPAATITTTTTQPAATTTTTTTTTPAATTTTTTTPVATTTTTTKSTTPSAPPTARLSGHGKQKAKTTPPKNHSQVTYVYDVTAEKMQVADSKWGVDAASLMMGVGLAAVVMVIVLLIWCFARKKRRENSNLYTQSGDVMPTRQDSKKVEYVNVTATASQSVYHEVTMATQCQSSRATTSESLRRPMDNYDDIILVEMPGFQAVRFGPEQDDEGYVAAIVHD